MKTTTFLQTIACTMLALSIAACKGHKSEADTPASDSTIVSPNATDSASSAPFVLKHLNVDKKRVMPYVICSEQTVDSLLAIADTVFSKTDTYKLENLGMENEDYNKWIIQEHKDTVTTAIALFDSYASMVNSGMDEANASFVWHEVARQQMKHFCEETGGEWKEPASPEKLLLVIRKITQAYEGGSQADINMSAWRAAMPIDYRLIEAYKQLADLCHEKSMAKLIHDDYMHMLTTFREYCDSIDEERHYSDLPRQQGMLFQWLLESKRENINQLIRNHKKGTIGLNAIRKNLQEHHCMDNHKILRLTKSLLDKEFDKFF